MQPRISIVTLGVTDVSRAIRFYRDGLGWPMSTVGDGQVAFFQLNGAVLALYPRAALAEDAKLNDKPGSPFNGFTLAHNVAERLQVDSTLDEAVQAGARLLKPAEDAFWGGRSGYFADPDGHAWEIAWNPQFPFDERGGLVLPM
ncbi:MAG TPA: VOC family protein [Gemmatimonadaceae bacterium]|nr:VOC family protein [Gemmatimonadaceae bacterium]